jgi:hypothetical protein
MHMILSGLTQIALQGLRKQSVPDAELLLSHRVADFLLEQGNQYTPEAQYVKVIADYHEAWDGRGLTQLQRCRNNYAMLNYILDEWMPWHNEIYDFRLIDVNRFVLVLFMNMNTFPFIQIEYFRYKYNFLNLIL